MDSLKKILIIIDMQKDFVDGVLGTKEACEVLPKVEEKIKNHHGLVIYTRDTHDEKYLDTQEGKKLPVLHCVEGTDGWSFAGGIGELANKSSSKIFNKTTFGSMDMVNYVLDICKEKQIEEIELVGVCTDICVISNAILLKAALPEMKLVVDSSCCAGVTPSSHNNALNTMNMCQIEII